MKDNKFISVLFLIMICLLLTGCTEKRKEKRQITNDAIKYLRDKYAWKEKDINIVKNLFYGKSDKSACFITCADNKAIIEYNNKQYNVTYNMWENKFSDDVQVEDIKQALLDELSEKNGKPKDEKIEFNSDISEYFDGTNLNSVIEYLRVEAYYDNIEEFNEENANEVLKEFYDKYKAPVVLAYFKNTEDYNNFFSYGSIVGPDWSNNSYAYEDKYVDFFMTNKDGKIEKNTNSIIKLGDGLIACGWNLKDDIKMEKIDPFDLNEIKNYNSSKYTVISNYYRLYSDTEDTTSNFFNVMMEDDSIINNYSVAQKYTDREDKVTTILYSSSHTNKLYFTKYYGVKIMDFVILEEK